MKPEAALRDRIVASVNDGFAEQIEFTKTLVRFPSLRGAEHTIQDFVFRSLRDFGLTMERFDMDRDAIARHPGGSKISEQHSDAPIVVGIHRPDKEAGRSLILQAHVDVVPAGDPALWTHPPFEPVIAGDWMFGRGSGDMKAGHAANLFALKALRRLGLQPAATVYVQSVVEEESTGNGALMTHLRGYRADAALIPEPEDEKLVRANTGVLWFQVKVQGHAVHVREMGAGANAIDAAYRVIQALRKLEAEWNARKAGREHFENEHAPDQPECRAHRGRRMGLLGAGLLHGRLPHRDLSGHERRRGGARDRAGGRRFRPPGQLPRQQPAARHLQRLLRRGVCAGAGLRRRGGPGAGASGRDRQAARELHHRRLPRRARLCALRQGAGALLRAHFAQRARRR